MLGRTMRSRYRAPFLWQYRCSTGFIVAVGSLAVFTEVFIYGVTVPVLPFALITRSGIGPEATQRWTSILLSVYGASLLVAAPISGWLSDRWSSRRTPFLLGLLALVASTALFCVGNSIEVLIAGRCLQGISAAVVWVVGFALVVDTVGTDDVGLAMGCAGFCANVGLLLGPLLGGIVFARSGYYATFAMAFGLAFLDIIARLLIIERKQAIKWRATASLQDHQSDPRNLENGRESGGEVATYPQHRDSIDSTGSATRINTASTVRGTYLTFDPNAVDPPVRKLPRMLYLLRSPRVLVAVWACLVQSILLTSFDTILPLFVLRTFHWDAEGAGLVYLPLVVAMFAGPWVGHLSDKYGPRWFATCGFTAACPPLLLLRLVNSNTLGQKVLLCALLLLIGCSLALVWAPIMAEIAHAVEAEALKHPAGFFGQNGVYGQAYSLTNAAWAGGMLIGPLLAGLTVTNADWGVVTLIMGCLSLAGAIPTAIWTGHRKQESDNESV